jgi:hypothetical protein
MNKVKTKYWIALGLVLLLAVACEDTFADEVQVVADMFAKDEQAAHGVCAAWNGLIAIKMEGALQEVIFDEAQRHYDFVERDYGEPATGDLIRKIMHRVKDAYNSEQFTWAELTAGGEACAAH